jgi:hypothetical protein
MTTKFISLATAIVLLDVFLQSRLSSNDPLFLFASNNVVVNAGLLILGCLMVAVSFKDKFRRWWSFVGCSALAVICGTVGIIGTFFSNMLYSFPNVLLPLDYMFLLEAGVVFGICSLSYQHAKVPYNLRLPLPSTVLFRLLANIAFPVPKALQSPNSSRTGKAQTA